jgi:hypothetical protein
MKTKGRSRNPDRDIDTPFTAAAVAVVAAVILAPPVRCLVLPLLGFPSLKYHVRC